LDGLDVVPGRGAEGEDAEVGVGLEGGREERREGGRVRARIGK